jgi:hypothetical protein
MFLKIKATLLVLTAILLAWPSAAQPVCVTMGPPPALGTFYGTPAAQVSGDLAFTQNWIDVYVYDFNKLPFGTAFGRADILMAPFAFSPGQSIRTNNINLLFDFRKVGFTPTKVTLYYLDQGGYENLAVNGALYRGELTSAPAFLGGANVAVTSFPVPGTSAKTGTVRITGPLVKTVMIGGQEFWVDQVCAAP